MALCWKKTMVCDKNHNENEYFLNDNFMTFFLTPSLHLPYTLKYNMQLREYLSLLSEILFSSNYILKQGWSTEHDIVFRTENYFFYKLGLKKEILLKNRKIEHKKDFLPKMHLFYLVSVKKYKM